MICWVWNNWNWELRYKNPDGTFSEAMLRIPAATP